MHSKFPARTIVLMALTLVAFGWFWWQTHSLAVKPAPTYKVVKVISLEPVVEGDGGAR